MLLALSEEFTVFLGFPSQKARSVESIFLWRHHGFHLIFLIMYDFNQLEAYSWKPEWKCLQLWECYYIQQIINTTHIKDYGYGLCFIVFCCGYITVDFTHILQVTLFIYQKHTID